MQTKRVFVALPTDNKVMRELQRVSADRNILYRRLMSCKILNVRIDNFSLDQAKNKARDFLNSNHQYKIFTPNPEMLVSAHQDEYFTEVLNSGDLNLCDGRGLQFFAKENLTRITGVDFMLEVCALADNLSKSVYLLGSGSQDVVQKTKQVLETRYPNLRIVGTNPGEAIKIGKNGQIKSLQLDEQKNDSIIESIIMVAPDILFVALGHNKQEKWIDKFLQDLPSVKIAMGVGGAFDNISGKTKRAPGFFRQIGLEWLWRLVREPKRLKRIFTAVIIFPWLCFTTKKYASKTN